MKEVNEAILKKVKRLLAVASDSNDSESQSALLMAQRLMLEHNIGTTELYGDAPVERHIVDEYVTPHKRLFWWERMLANIISHNFRVEMYYEGRSVFGKGKKSTTSIKFFGYEDDLELAKGIYNLALEALTMYTKRFVDNYYGKSSRTYSVTNELKNSYMKGFLTGLSVKFNEQVAVLKNKNELMVLVPTEVKEKFELMTEDFKEVDSYSTPAIEHIEAYNKGYKDGDSIDFTKSTIDNKVVAY